MTKNWALVQHQIRDLYAVQGKSLVEVRDYLECNQRFVASIRAYRMKIQEWGFKRTASRRRGRGVASSTLDSSSACPEVRGLAPSDTGLDHALLPPDLILAVLDEVERGSASYFLEHALRTNHHLLLNRPLAFNPALPQLSRYAEYSGEHLLFIAAKSSSADVVKLLLDCGASVKQQGCLPENKHLAPLNAAIQHNSAPVVRELIRGGAVENGRGSTALCFAIDHARDPSTILDLVKHDEGSALDYALVRRERDYGSELHGTATAIVRHLLDDAQIKPQSAFINHHARFLAPYERTREWGRCLNADEIASLLHFVNSGLPLQSRKHRPASNGKEWHAKLEHDLLFHTPSPDLMHALATKLDLQDSALGTNLLHVLSAGCEQEYAIYTNRHVGPAMWSLIHRGANPNAIYQRESHHPESQSHHPLETVFHAFLKRAMRCAPGGLQSQELVLAELSILLGPGRANPCRQPDSSYPIDTILRCTPFTTHHPDYARDLVEALLAHFPANFHRAEAPPPPWLRRLAPFFPLGPDYAVFADGARFHEQVWRESGYGAAGVQVFVQAARMVAMKRFLRGQLHAERSARLYDGIREVLRAQEDMGAPGESFPRRFVLEVLSLRSGCGGGVQPRRVEGFAAAAAGYYERGSQMVGQSYAYEGYQRLEQQAGEGDALQIESADGMVPDPIWQQHSHAPAFTPILPDQLMDGLMSYGE